MQTSSQNIFRHLYHNKIYRRWYLRPKLSLCLQPSYESVREFGIQDFWLVMPCLWASGHHESRNTIYRNGGNHLPKDIASYPRRPESSQHRYQNFLCRSVHTACNNFPHRYRETTAFTPFKSAFHLGCTQLQRTQASLIAKTDRLMPIWKRWLLTVLHTVIHKYIYLPRVELICHNCTLRFLSVLTSCHTW